MLKITAIKTNSFLALFNKGWCSHLLMQSHLSRTRNLLFLMLFYAIL